MPLLTQKSPPYLSLLSSHPQVTCRGPSLVGLGFVAVRDLPLPSCPHLSRWSLFCVRGSSRVTP